MPAYCGLFDSVGKCITDPCNCGQSEKRKTEYWGYDASGSIASHTYSADKNCPPYEKFDDREGCLKRFAPARKYARYQRFCAESSPTSNYYQPQVKVRIQTCLAHCWTGAKTLNWDGECESYGGPLGVPLTRLCARVTLPANGEPGSPEYRSADPGYGQYKYARGKGYSKTSDDGSINEDDTFIVMDENGWEVEIPEFIDAEGNPFRQKMPKICVYEDFTVLDYIRGKFDVIDIIPDSQPMHYNPGAHPVIKVISSIIRFSGQLKKKLPNLLLKALSFIPGLDFLDPILDLLFYLINWQSELLAWVLDNVGRINNSVADYPIGCVELPLGPFPPPFPKTLQDFPQAPKLDNICAYNEKPSRARPCVTSSLKNNYINNTVRIGYDNMVPLCENLDEDDLESDGSKDSPRCVTLKGGLTTAAILHQTLQNDVIPACDQENVNGLCAEFKPRGHFCDVAYDSDSQTSYFDCNAGYRLIYGLQRGTNITKQNFYDEAIPECKQGSGDACQMVWGINIGPFMDVSLKFPSREYFYMTGEERGNVSMYATPLNQSSDPKEQIPDTRRKGRFHLVVSRQTMEDNETGYTQEAQEICAYDKTFPSLTRVIGCVARPNPPLPMKIQNCADSDAKLYCNSTLHAPMMIVGLEAEASEPGEVDEAYGILGIKHITPSGPNDSTAKINLAGYDVTAFATDDDFRVMPFTGIDALSQSIIVGNYKDDILPYYIYLYNVETRPSAIYLNGLAYNNQVYYGGGTRICVSKAPELLCSPHTEENCVLSGLSYSDYTDCDNFNNTLRHNYPGLRMCVLEERGALCDNVEEVPGNQPLIIRRCNDTEYCYAYKNDQTFAKLHPSISGAPYPLVPTAKDQKEAERYFSRPVCTVDLTREGRIDPAPSAGAVLSKDQHYHFQKSEPVTRIEKYQVQLDYFNALQKVFDVFQRAVETQRQADEAYAEVKNKYSSEREVAIAEADRLNMDAQSAWSLARKVPDDNDEAWQNYLAQKAKVAEEGSLEVVNAPYPQKAVEEAKSAAERIVLANNNLSSAYQHLYSALNNTYDAQQHIADQPTVEHALSLLNIATQEKGAFIKEYNQQLGMANNSNNIDSAIATTRSKTVVEQGLCTTIDQPSCPAVPNQGGATGFVGWEEAQYGTLSHATSNCPPGKFKRDNEGLERYCLYDQITGNLALEPLLENYKGCAAVWSCYSEDNKGKETGFVSWPAAEINHYSSVECPLGYDPKKDAKGNPLRRRCTFNSAIGKAELEPMEGKGCEFAPRPCYVIPHLPPYSMRVRETWNGRFKSREWDVDDAPFAIGYGKDDFELELSLSQKKVDGAWQNFTTMPRTKVGSGEYRMFIRTPLDDEDLERTIKHAVYEMKFNLEIGDSTTVESMYIYKVRFKDHYLLNINGHDIAKSKSFRSPEDIDDSKDEKSEIQNKWFDWGNGEGVMQNRKTGTQRINFLEHGDNDFLVRYGVAPSYFLLIPDDIGSGGLEFVLNFKLDCDDYDRSKYDSYEEAYRAGDTLDP